MKWCKCGYVLVVILVFVSVMIQVVDVIIMVNGKVVVKLCMVFIINVMVDFGDFYFFSFMFVGVVLVWYDVVFELTNCLVGMLRVIVSFSGVVDSIGYYKNQGIV